MWAGRYSETSKVTPRMRRFAELYTGDGAAAARQAGYSKSSARFSAHALLKHPHVRAIIAAKEAKLVSKKIKTTQELREWWTEVIDDTTAEPEVRLKASLLLGRSLGMFIDRKEIDSRHTMKLPDGLTVEQCRALARGEPMPQLEEAEIVEPEDDDPGPH